MSKVWRDTLCSLANLLVGLSDFWAGEPCFRRLDEAVGAPGLLSSIIGIVRGPRPLPTQFWHLHTNDLDSLRFLMMSLFDVPLEISAMTRAPVASWSMTMLMIMQIWKSKRKPICVNNTWVGNHFILHWSAAIVASNRRSHFSGSVVSLKDNRQKKASQENVLSVFGQVSPNIGDFYFKALAAL